MLTTKFSGNRRHGLALLVSLLITTLALPANAGTVTGLLEKAIYTEETVGDLEEAIEIYQKVLAESKNSINAAAQAQFRIGTCYAKQGKTDEAAIAFQAVVDDYPQAAEWVAQAKSRLPGNPELLPVPWGEGDEMHYEMKLPTGMGIGHQVYRISKLEKNGRLYWECAAWQNVTLNGQAGKSRVLVDYETFAPIESQWKHTMLGDSEAIYGKDQVVIRMANKDETVSLDFDGPVYDNEQGAEVFRRLPMKVGYKTKLTIIPILTGSKLSLSMNVTKMETIEVPAGTFECFRLSLDDLNQTFWISNDEHRYLVRFKAGGIVADLMEVRQSNSDEGRTLKHERFTMSLPPDWLAYTPSNSEEKRKIKTWLIDPSASVNARVITVPRDLIEEERGTPREWLEYGLQDNPKQMKEFSLSQKGVESTTAGNREAVEAIYEWLDGDKPKKARRIILYGDEWAMDLRFATSADDFEKLQPTIDAILDGLRLK
jgi:hypothetical protein